MTRSRIRRGRRPMPGVAPGVTEQARAMVQAAWEEAERCENKLFGEMYATALERRVYSNDNVLFNFMKHLTHAPVSIEEFLVSEEFIGATDLKIWPEVRDAVVAANKDWWKGMPEACHEILLMGATGTGKCLGKGTPVLMYDGTIKRVEDVVVGDLLMGPDSTPRTVLSLARGRESLYRVTPTKGDSYVVNESHILSLKITGMGTTRHGNPKNITGPNGVSYASGDIADVSVRDYLASGYSFSHCAKGWRVGVEFAHEAPLPVDPYFVGLWVGDGTAASTAITTQDDEIVEYLYSYASSLSLRVAQYAYGDACPAYSIVNRKGRSNALLDSMRSIGLSLGHKFIPHRYLTSTREDRLALLAGLLDSDGHLTCNCFDFVSEHYEVSEGVMFLARSLGFAAYCKRVKKNDQNGMSGTYYRVSISGDTHLIPTKVKRKKAEKRRQAKDVLVTGISVESIGEGDYYGFSIDGDRRFLLGDFTVTHNTEISKLTTLYHLYLLSCIDNPQAYYGLPKATSIVFPIMAAKPHVTKKVIYDPLRHMVENIPYFQKHLRPSKLVESEMIFEEKNIRVTPAGVDADSILGEAVVGGVIDEINFMNVVLRSKRAEVTTGRAGVYDQAQTIHSSMTRRVKGRFTKPGPKIGIVCTSSSTRYRGDFTDKRKQQVIDHKERGVYIYDKAQYEVKPQENFCGERFRLLVGNDILNDVRILEDGDTYPEGARVLSIPVEYESEFRRDPHSALRDICGISTSSISPFIQRRFKIYEAITAGEEEGLASILIKDNVILGVDGMPIVKFNHYCTDPSKPRYVHVDLSKTGDRCGIAMLRYDGLTTTTRSNGAIESLPVATIEVACSIEPDSNNEIDFAEVRTWIKQLRDIYGYPIKAVTYDGIFSIESIQQWRKLGMKTGNISVDRTSAPYKNLRDAYNDNRIRMFQQDVLVNELFELEYDDDKDKVDHPVNGSKDVADAVCGAYYSLLTRRSSWVNIPEQGGQGSDRPDGGDRYDEDRRY